MTHRHHHHFAGWTLGLALLSTTFGAPTVASAQDFVRGDANGDGAVDLTDAVAILDHLFNGVELHGCLDAADVDDDGSITISDAIGLLDYLYQGGTTPPAPFASAGLDPTAAHLSPACGAPTPGSCWNQCEAAAGTCWCDLGCATYGDCCADYEAACAPEDPDAAAIAAVLDAGVPLSLMIDHTMLRPDDRVLTVMAETETGFPLTFELATTPFTIGAAAVEARIDLDTLRSVHRLAGSTATSILPEEIPIWLVAEEHETHYFCHREDGDGGPILVGLVTMRVGNTTAEVAVNLRRDGLEQPGQSIVHPAAGPDGGGASEGEMVWGLSWFSDDCKRKEGVCPSKPCEVTLAALLDFAGGVGLNFDKNATVQGIIDALAGLGLSVGGDCRESYLFGFVPVGCQCWLVTF